MRIGFLSSYDKERIEFAKKNGFGSIELLTGYFSDAPDFMPGHDGWQAKADAMKADYDAADINISCIGAFYMNHMDPASEAQCKNVVKDAILLAEYLKIPVVAGFSGRIINTPLENSIPKFREIWGEHAKFADDHGIKIAFECCPMGEYHTPSGGINCITGPDMYEKCFNSVESTALGLEWDPSHLIPVFADPIINIRKFGKRIYHVHAKSAKVYWDLVRNYGIWYPNAIEHCHPGFGDDDWGQIIKELRRAGYHGDLNIEGWHDGVFRDTKGVQLDDIIYDKSAVAPDLEDAGLIIAKNYLEQWCPKGY
ncbi:MAG: sugar phosphate isomerase/epimerase family protein [Armatimonadota bacterium]